MAIRLIDRYPNRADPATSNYPHGKGRNKSDPTADDGTPFDEDRFNDYEAFFQGILEAAGITPSGNVDTVPQSDYIDALVRVANGIIEIDMAGDTDVTLDVHQGRIAALRLFGDLTGDVDLIAPDTARYYVVINDTGGDFGVTFRTETGTGVVVRQGGAQVVYSDGSDAYFAVLPYVDEDDMASDSDAAVPTQQSVKAFTSTRSAQGRKVSLVDEAVDASWGSNATIYTAQQIVSFNGNQYMAYWKSDGTLRVGKRALPDGAWSFNAPGVTIASEDPHWNCSIIVDPNGRLLICYNTRNSTIKWRYSTNPEDISSWSAEQVGMTGANEASAGYPCFTYGPDKKVLFLYREGSSGNGDLMVNEWDHNAGTLADGWSAAAHPLIEGTSQSPTVNPYWWIPPYAKDGVIHLFWCWRETSDASTNHDLLYAKSEDGGATWKKSDGTVYTLPITKADAEVVETIAQGSSFANQGTAATDPDGTPHVAYFRDDGAGIPQFFRAYLSGSSWQIEQISSLTFDWELSNSGAQELQVGRPGIEVYDDGSVLVFGRVAELGNGLRCWLRYPGEEWQVFRPSGENLIGWEPQWDRVRFRDTQELHLLVVPTSSQKVGAREFSSPLSVWSWAGYHAIAQSEDPTVAVVASTSRAGPEQTTTSTSYTDLPLAMGFSDAAFGLKPTHARLVARLENTSSADPVYMRMQVDDVEDAGLIGRFGTFGEVSTPDGDVYVRDSGWVEIPRTDNGKIIRLGAVNVQARADGGEFRSTAWTLMLGARTG